MKVVTTFVPPSWYQKYFRDPELKVIRERLFPIPGRKVGTDSEGAFWIYEGEILNDKLHGNGIRTFANGTTVEGTWLQDKGTGKYKFKSENLTMEGYLNNGMRLGLSETIANGQVQINAYQNNKIHGRVITISADKKVVGVHLYSEGTKKEEHLYLLKNK